MKKITFIAMILMIGCNSPEDPFCKYCVVDTYSIGNEKFAITSTGDTLHYISGGANYYYVNQVNTSHLTDSVSFLLLQGIGGTGKIEIIVNDDPLGYYAFDNDRTLPVLIPAGYNDIQKIKFINNKYEEVYIGTITLNSVDLVLNWGCPEHDSLTFLGLGKFIINPTGYVTFENRSL